MSRARTFLLAGLLLSPFAGCSSTPGTPETTADAASDAPAIVLPADAHAADAGHTDAAGPSKDATVTDEASPPTDATAPQSETGDDSGGFDANFGDVITIGPSQCDASVPDAASDAAKVNACGICDRVWNCNGFSQTWVSTGPEACTDTVNCQTLYCENGNTIDYADGTNNDGSWKVTSTGLALDYDNLGGGTMEIDCIPGS